MFRVAVIMGLLILLASPTVDWNMRKQEPVTPIVVNEPVSEDGEFDEDVEQPRINPARPVNQKM